MEGAVTRDEWDRAGQMVADEAGKTGLTPCSSIASMILAMESA
jgi:hypothetical protein